MGLTPGHAAIGSLVGPHVEEFFGVVSFFWFFFGFFLGGGVGCFGFRIVGDFELGFDGVFGEVVGSADFGDEAGGALWAFEFFADLGFVDFGFPGAGGAFDIDGWHQFAPFGDREMDVT